MNVSSFISATPPTLSVITTLRYTNAISGTQIGYLPIREVREIKAGRKGEQNKSPTTGNPATLAATFGDCMDVPQESQLEVVGGLDHLPDAGLDLPHQHPQHRHTARRRGGGNAAQSSKSRQIYFFPL